MRQLLNTTMTPQPNEQLFHIYKGGALISHRVTRIVSIFFNLNYYSKLFWLDFQLQINEKIKNDSK